MRQLEEDKGRAEGEVVDLESEREITRMRLGELASRVPECPQYNDMLREDQERKNREG